MAATREQVINALFVKLKASGAYVSVGRRLRKTEGSGAVPAAQTPVLMLLDHSEEIERTPGLPPTRSMYMTALIYTDVGDDENAIPSSTINILLEGLEAALAPDSPGTGRCTLGGLVQSVTIEGEVIKAPGDVLSRSLCAVPIRILLP